MSSSDLQQRIEAAKTAVLAQTELMHRDFGRAHSHWKKDGTRVTSIDLAISENISRSLGRQFPSDQIFSEELAHEGGAIPVNSRYCWMLDPIDGTNNYATGLAHCAIALALFEQGRPIYGVIYDLSRRTLLHGGPGLGAWDGERPIRVRDETPDSQSLVGFHSPYDHRHSQQALRVIESCKIRGLGSSTLHLAYVAAGFLDGVVDHNVKLWDIAAAIPLLWAAGGELRFLNGDPLPLLSFDLQMQRIQYVAGSKTMCDHLCSILLK